MTPSDQNWPRCACGCGEAVPIRKASKPEQGLKVGDPCKFVAGHSVRTRRLMPKDGQKRCSKCGVTRSVAEFHKDRNRASGLAPQCKACCAAKARDWYERNRDHWLQASTRYHRENPEVSRAAAARWSKLHPAEIRRFSSGRRARLRGLFVEHVDPLVVLGRDAGVCGICEDEVNPDDFHVDHVIPLSRGGEHSYANVQVAHPSCNCRKKDQLPEEAMT